MKNLTSKQKILIVLLAIIIISGIIVTVTIGLKFDLKYEKSQKIELNLKKEFEISDIKTITDEVLKGQDVIIQKVELYEDFRDAGEYLVKGFVSDNPAAKRYINTGRTSILYFVIKTNLDVIPAKERTTVVKTVI